MKKTSFSLFLALILAGVVSMPSVAGIKFSGTKIPAPRTYTLQEYLSDKNEAMDQALLIHNMMNEMPDLKETATTLGSLQGQEKLLSDTLQQMNSCGAKKLGKVFKEPQKVWDKMMATYEQRRQAVQEKSTKGKVSITPQQKAELEKAGWDINREIMMDVYQNPGKWGSVNKDTSFPLWKDQAALFEKQWTQFYETINMAYGVDRAGRPAVDAATRQDARKYDQVLAAHKAYVAKIGKGKKVDSKIASMTPPKAPVALPSWQNVVRVDARGNVYPEMPEPWKQMASNQFKSYSDKGEMAEFFDGKTLKPSEVANANTMGDLERQYDMVMAVDALQKGVEGSSLAQKDMVRPFAEQLASVGINIPNFDITNAKHYKQAFDQLKTLKQKSIADAYQYVKKLEEQDQKNPDFVARRNKVMNQRKARLSAEAQSSNSELSQILQTGQMAPATRQKLVLAALETDENATVFLTETNAVNVDQLIRESRSTGKLLAESQNQLKYSLQQQEKLKPEMAKCQF